jgi:MFS family permease
MFLNFSIFGSWSPVLSPLLEQRGFTPRQSAWIFATNAMGAIFGPVVWGQIADRWLAAEKCISVCCLVSATCLWWLAVCTHPWLVFWGCFAFWMFMIPALSVGASLTFRHLQHPDKEYGRVRMWGTVGWIAAGWLLGAWYALAYPPDTAPEAKDWGDALRWGAAFGWLTAAYAWSLPHTPPLPRTASSEPSRGWLAALLDAPLRATQLFRQRSFAVLCVCLFGVYVTFPFSAQMTPLYLEQLGVPKRWLPVLLTIAQSLEVATLALLPVLLVRLGQKGTMMFGLLAWCAALSVYAWGGQREIVIGSLALHGIFICCFLVAAQLYINRLARDDVRASAQGLMQVINGLGLFLGHLAVGQVRGWTGDNYAQAFLPGAIVAGLLIVVFGLGFRVSRH